jgi:hypothetical protein
LFGSRGAGYIRQFPRILLLKSNKNDYFKMKKRLDGIGKGMIKRFEGLTPEIPGTENLARPDNCISNKRGKSIYETIHIANICGGMRGFGYSEPDLGGVREPASGIG